MLNFCKFSGLLLKLDFKIRRNEKPNSLKYGNIEKIRLWTSLDNFWDPEEMKKI